MSVKKVEYKVESLDKGDPIDEDVLDRLGAEGFSLVARHEYMEAEYADGREYRFQIVQLVFSREVPSE